MRKERNERGKRIVGKLECENNEKGGGESIRMF
jgi:hypothetical protein